MPPMGGPGGRYLTEEEKKNMPKVTKGLLLRVFSYLKPYWKQLAVALGCIVISEGLFETDPLHPADLRSLSGLQSDRGGGELSELLDCAAHHL